MPGRSEATSHWPGEQVSLDAARSEAARVAACVDLRDVRLWGVQADLSTVPDEREFRLSYSFDAGLEVQHSKDDAILLVLGTYALGVRAVPPPNESEVDAAEPDADEATEVASISFKLNALFEVERVPEDQPFSDPELTAFGETTGQFALYPYAREFVASLTSRMGLPPLHMSVMRLHLESRTDD